MKKFTKIFAMMLVVVMVVGMFSTVAFAAGNNPFEAAMTEATTQAQDTEVNSAIKEVGGQAIKIIQAVGYIVAVVMVLIFGIKWMMATPQKKQELKDRMWNLAIGVILLVGGVSILGWVSNFAESITN